MREANSLSISPLPLNNLLLHTSLLCPFILLHLNHAPKLFSNLMFHSSLKTSSQPYECEVYYHTESPLLELYHHLATQKEISICRFFFPKRKEITSDHRKEMIGIFKFGGCVSTQKTVFWCIDP